MADNSRKGCADISEIIFHRNSYIRYFCRIDSLNSAEKKKRKLQQRPRS